MRIDRAAITIVLLLGLVGASLAENGTLKGIMFGDYYYVVSADSNAAASEKQNAFQFRRLYFTYDKNIAEDFSIRYRLEASDKGYGQTAKMVPFVKIAQLKWAGAVANADLYVGLTGTPTWSISEAVWGYRSVEKTILDLNKIGSSADIGVGLSGKAGGLAYRLMLGNGPGQKPEDDNGKKIYGQVAFKPAGGVQLVGYADINMRPASQNQMTVKGFAALQQDALRVGVEAFMRINKEKVANGDDETISGVSVFGAMDVMDKCAAFARLDVVNNDAKDTTKMLVIAGVDHSPAKNIHLMPNLYVDLPDGPDPSIQARVTASYKF